jgi:hypothetical protein
MTESALRRIWGALGSALLVFSVACFLRTTGAKLLDSGINQSSLDPHAVPLFSIPIIWALSVLVLRVTREHAALVAMRKPGAIWADKLPIFFFDTSDIQVDQPLGKLYQRWMLILFLILPFVILVHQFLWLMDGTVTFGNTEILRGWRQLWPVERIDWGHWRTDYRMSGPQYWPWLEPWLFLTMVLHVAWRLVGTLHPIVRGSRMPKKAAEVKSQRKI